jgi:arginine deiminase
MLRVTSEVGRLRRALVHEPGIEVDRMVPGMLGQLLFDDILYGERAREEHGLFRRVMQLLGVEVVDAAELLATTLEQQAARDWIVDVALGRLPRRRRDELRELPPAMLAATVVGGVQHKYENCSGGIAAERLYEITPLPNWCFQRDPQVVFGDGVLIGSMATPVRHAESLLSRVIFRHHPRFGGDSIRMDPGVADGGAGDPADSTRPTIEGGDVLVLSKDIVAVGLSERTNQAGVLRLARNLARLPEGPRWLLVVDLPHRRAYMHLDTLFTQADRDLCLVHAPVILPGGFERAAVAEIDLRDPDLQESARDDLLSALKRRGMDLEPVACGGTDPVAQQREQWTDGANTLALAPGVITLFDRNHATAAALEARGFTIVPAEELLLGKTEVAIDRPGRVCILIPSYEISRARGGPHCLVHPLVRDDVESTPAPR